MTIAVLKELHEGERRVALVPAHAPGLIQAGHRVLIEAGAGLSAGYTDAEYAEKGAELIHDRRAAAGKADLIMAVRAGAADPKLCFPYDALKAGAVIVAMMDPWQAHPSFKRMADAGATAFALELIPRTTRAQAMDVLSSQANLAGYEGVVMAASASPKLFPMMMTAAGTIMPSKVFVLGVGVAGLQAVATAKRLGAVVSAFDVRASVKEQVESLGARFVEFELGDASGAGGYAKALSPEQEARQKEMMAAYIKRESIDVIVATAAIPGRPSPKLITDEMVKAMAPGSVIVDLASERGGNCALTRPGETVQVGGVTIAGPLNVPSRAAFHASQLLSKNLSSFLSLIIAKDGSLAVDKADDIVSACLILDRGLPADEKTQATLGL